MNKLKKTVLISCLLGLSMTTLACPISVFGNPLFICYFMYRDAKEGIQNLFARLAKPFSSNKEKTSPEIKNNGLSEEEKTEQEG